MISSRPSSMYIPQQTIDWDQPYITGTHLQPEVVESKFALWDKTVSEDWIGNPEMKSFVAELISDPTIYEYAFYTDDEGEPFKYTAYQDLIAQCAISHDFTPDNPNRYLLYRAANQMGKSRLLIGLAKYIALNMENRNVVIISKSLPQAQFVLAELRKSLNNSKFADTWREDIGETANTTQITFERDVVGTNGIKRKIINRIICAPAGEGALGYPIHHLFLDEVDFYEDGKTIFWKVLFARTKKTKGQIICFSNPNPDQNKNQSILWELWDGDLFLKKFHFNFLDAPWNTIAEFERDRRNSPEHIFASTHLGEWSDLSGSFFTQQQLDAMLDRNRPNKLPALPKGETVYIAADLGKMRDSTVITIGTASEPNNQKDKYRDLECHYVEIMKLRTTYDGIIDRLEELRNHYLALDCKVANIGFDATGQKTFGDFMRKRNIPCTPVDFSSKKSNKTQLYNDFLLLAQNGKIKIPYTREAEKQLAGLVFKETETKKLKVENKTDTYHDDIPDSLAILIHISVTPGKKRPSISFVSTHTEKKQETREEYAMRRTKEVAQHRLAQIQRAVNKHKTHRNYY